MYIPIHMKVADTGSSYRLEMWLRLPGMARFFTFFIPPKEMAVDIGEDYPFSVAYATGVVGVRTVNKARRELNVLLETLGLELVE